MLNFGKIERDKETGQAWIPCEVSQITGIDLTKLHDCYVSIRFSDGSVMTTYGRKPQEDDGKAADHN